MYITTHDYSHVCRGPSRTDRSPRRSAGTRLPGINRISNHSNNMNIHNTTNSK